MLKRELGTLTLAFALVVGIFVIPSNAQPFVKSVQQQEQTDKMTGDKMQDDKMTGDKMTGKKKKKIEKIEKIRR